MKPPPFDYVKPGSLDECLDLLSTRPEESKILSGGQSLVPLMNLRLARPQVLIDVNGLAELTGERRLDGVLELGALERHAALATSPTVRAATPLLAEAAALIGYPAIRNRGTLGGSIAHADPAAELPCACVALGADVVVRSSAGQRTVAADDFFVGHFTTSLEPDEMVTAVRLPATKPGEGSAFEEFVRKTGDFAVAAAAVRLAVSGGRIHRARVALAGVAGRPVRAPLAEEALTGEVPSEELFSRVGAGIASEIGDGGGADGEGFRAGVAGVLVSRALAKAARRAIEEGADGR